MDDRDYFYDVIAHFRGYRHDGCTGEKLADDSLRAIDPVGSSFREMAVKTEYPRMDDRGNAAILSTQAKYQELNPFASRYRPLRGSFRRCL